MNMKQVRRQLIIAMGSTCSGCGAKFDPDNLIIHHTQFEEGKPLGYNNRQRQEMLCEFARSGKIPADTQLLCDRCNRKRHKYRRSNRDIFGSDVKSMPDSPPATSNSLTD